MTDNPVLRQKLNTILLIDDDPNCNFLHRRVISKSDCSNGVVVQEAGEDALNYLTSHSEDAPELIFLDLNMPGMSGWEFIEEFRNLPVPVQERVKIMVLTSSLNPDDQERAANTQDIAGMYDKLLTQDTLQHILKTHFPDRL